MTTTRKPDRILQVLASMAFALGVALIASPFVFSAPLWAAIGVPAIGVLVILLTLELFVIATDGIG